MSEKIPIEHIEKLIHIPAENPDGYVIGYLDWITGIIRLNFTSEEYNSLIENPNLWELYLKTNIHEMFHFYQILTSGYLFNYVINITTDVLVNTFNMEENLLFEAIKDNRFSTTVEEKVVKKISIIHKCGGDNNLSIIDLVEGAAFYAQEVAGKNSVDHNHIIRKIKYIYKDSEYSKAYLAITSSIGEKAFYIFPKIIYFCLKFSDPVYVFDIINAEIHLIKHKIKNSHHNNIGLMKNDFISIIKDKNHHHKSFGMIENPLEVEEKNNDNHPFYSESLKMIQERGDIDKIITFITNPKEIKSDIFLETLRPVLLNNEH